MNFTDPTVIMFSIYLFAMLFIGVLGYRRTNNLDDYILGGRSLGSFVTALSAGASDMSGWLLMGLPGAIYLTGVSEAWIAVGLSMGAYLNWRFVAARLRLYTERANNALTLPDYFSNRFEDKQNLLRILTTVVILVFFTIYCASGVVAGARLFENMFGLPYQTALWVGAACTIAYVFIGGFLAVSWTDTIQASLIFTALIVAPAVAYFAVTTGLQPTQTMAALMEPAQSDILQGASFVGVVSLLAWGLGYFGQPHILVRFMAAQSASTIPAARRISMTWMILCLAGAVAVGYIGIPYFLMHPDGALAVNANSETVFIELTKQLFNPWIGGVLLAAILAAVMSTLSCQLLVCSSALTEDIYHTFLRKDAGHSELVWVGRGMVMAIALVAIVIAGDPESKVLGMVSYAWAGFGAAFGPAVILSLFWSHMTRNGALAGILVGAVTVLVWKQFGWLGLYEIVPGFLFAWIATVVVSRMSQPSQTMLSKHEAVELELSKL
ncbi:sodium/proline symporter PutP [Actimicrobium sp. CCI2.3]|uniref:sodium/proline symporter PutP n=1 Tax=Actimicrobium sp. CCI2.3 TaxID=3048616 RepID=UPI002AB43585|nr:sodium/proline symporter PutP [Actimicrobium sp. CCI2.3]MDY7574800.1 sodium/proline symporter PutP [Actimicrobium sp. CCI2.3]MEB0020239.1 sodium/proline symporter PutP [Actimicrobium sp. CCI2.3]